MSNGPIIPQEVATRRLEDALRLRVGRGRRYSFSALSDATGIAPRTLESYVQGASPSLANLLSICAVLGPGFTSDVLAPAGQIARDGNNDDPEHMQALCTLMGFAAQLAEAVSDGHVDHREAAQMQPMAQQVIDLIEPIARGGVAQFKRARA